MYSTISTKRRDSTHSQAVLGKCTRGVDALLRLVADIAYLKVALGTWKGIKSPEAVFVAACREGRKPEAQQAKSAVVAPFEWARKERIVLAMSGEDVYTPEGEAWRLRR